MLPAIVLSSLIILSIADDNGGCCECTDPLYGPNCNEECDSNICSYDPYCCNVEWDWICADAACTECDDCHQEEEDYGPWGDYNDYGDYGDYGDYDYQDSWYDDYDQYGYDYECDCNYICGDESPEEWESNIYEEVPECIVDNCPEQFQACAFNDECVVGIENVVNNCYESDDSSQGAVECLDALIADEENAGFTAACNGNEECGADLQALGTCVANQANYGFCPEEVMKKLNLRSLVKRIKIQSRKSKRKSAALKSKSKRSRKKRSRPRSRKVRGRRQSKLRSRQSQRKLQSDSESPDSYEYENEYDYGSDYDNPEYDYGCYCDCGEEDDEIPPCIIDNCSEQLFGCTSSEDCVQGIVGVEATCYEDNDNPEECMDELIQESNGQQAIELCNGNETAAGDLQVLGQCVSNVFASGDCGEPYKKLKIKALIRSTKKVRARKVASKLRRSRSLQRARFVRAQRLRKAKLVKKQRVRSRTRPRPRAEAQRKARAQRVRKLRSKRQRPMKLRERKQKVQRRKLGSAGGDEACCDCTEEEDGTGCSANPECDQIVCPLDSWCCNNQWDYICANGANNICNAADYWSWDTNYDDYGDESWYDDSYYPGDSGTDGSCCDCTGESYGPGCNAVCDNEVCPLDSYCCNNQWDSICANGADNICQGYDYFGSFDNSWNDDWNSYSYEPYSWDNEPYYGFDSNWEPYTFEDSYGYGEDEPYAPPAPWNYQPYESSPPPSYQSEPYESPAPWNYQPYESSPPSYQPYESPAPWNYQPAESPAPWNYQSYYPPAKQRKARVAKREGARSRRAIAQKRRERIQGRKMKRGKRLSKRSTK